MKAMWLPCCFSPALPNPAAYLDRATVISPATTVGRDGLTATLAFDDARE